MLQDHERIGRAQVLDPHARARGRRAHEQLVLRHLTVPDHRRRADAVRSERAVALRHDQPVRGRVRDRDRALRQDGQLLRRVPRRAVRDPQLAISVRLGLLNGRHRPRKHAMVRSEVRIRVRLPVQHLDEIVEVTVVFRPHVLHQQIPWHDAPVHLRLEHREHVAVDLRLVGDERSGRVQNPRVDLPAGPRLEPEGLGEKRDAVVAAAPALEARAHLRLRRARREPHERVREIVVSLVVLRRKVVGLRLAAPADQLRLCLALVHVVRDRAHVVEELAEQVPALLALHDGRPEQRIAGLVHRVLEEEAASVVEPYVAQAFVWWRAGSVVRVGRRREPPLVDAAAMRPARVEVVRMELQPSARDHEGAGHPAGLETENSPTGAQRGFDLRSLAHVCPDSARDPEAMDDTTARNGRSSRATYERRARRPRSV